MADQYDRYNSDHREQQLCLVWKHPRTRRRYLIGYLSRDRAGYYFRYDLVSVNDAIQAGFRLLDSFPTREGRWDSPTLFATFARRLPPRWRAEEMHRVGLPYDDPMEFFRLTGGRVTTDTLEFLEPITPGERAGEYTLRFPVAGWRYYRGESVIDEFRPGTPVHLEREPGNIYDPSAIRVLSPSGVHVGYVPVIYAWYLEEAVATGQYEATVDSLGDETDPQQRVVVRFHGWNVPLDHPLDMVRYIPEGIERYAASLLQ